MSEQFWRDFVYVQRDVEDKQTFSDNWDRIFGKKEEEPHANNQDNDAGDQQTDGL